MRAKLSIAVFTGFALTGCVQTFPGGAVETRAQAAALADHSCHDLDPAPTKRWAAKLDGTTWELWKGHGGVIVSTSIDAKTGTFASPAAACVMTPDDG